MSLTEIKPLTNVAPSRPKENIKHRGRRVIIGPWDSIFKGRYRNDPCGCGSGLKVKRCCGRTA